MRGVQLAAASYDARSAGSVIPAASRSRRLMDGEAMAPPFALRGEAGRHRNVLWGSRWLGSDRPNAMGSSAGLTATRRRRAARRRRGLEVRVRRHRRGGGPGGFLAVCREAFDLPAAVVRWEQLDGCLRSLDLEDEGLLVVWDGWASLADGDPDTFEMAVEVFQDACVSWRDDEVPGSVLLVGDGPETDLPAV